jgi:hypothetical protein
MLVPLIMRPAKRRKCLGRKNFDVRGVRTIHRLGQDEHNLVPGLIKGARQAIAGDPKATSNKRRKFPAQHEDPHGERG